MINKKIYIMKIILIFLVLVSTFLILPACSAKGGTMQSGEKFFFPSEEALHEGTWLTWPHQYTYGKKYRDEIEPIWVAMAKALSDAENVHIIAYDKAEKSRIADVLKNGDVNLNRVDFCIAKSNDVWVRDTGPMFLYGEDKRLVIADFGFDGWGKKVKYSKDDAIPSVVAADKNYERIDINEFVLEGGAIELDGNGTLMAARSSVCSSARNKKMKLEVVESYLKKYFSVTNFIWLDGVIGEDITDAHIDGTARFASDNHLLTVTEEDYYKLYENNSLSDYNRLKNAKNANGLPYDIVKIPLTARYAEGLDYYGSYLNFYVGNGVVLVPIYRDVNDAVALKIIAELFPSRKIVPIDVTGLFKYGGMLHCVTQQQPKIIN